MSPIEKAQAILAVVFIVCAVFALAEIVARLGASWEAGRESRKQRRLEKRLRESKVVIKRNWGFADGRVIR